MQINIRQLKCFQAVLITGTTKNAAHILNMSQPAASMTIKNLEHQVGFVLFNRNKGRLTPTPEAYQFYDTVKSALNGVDNISYVAEEIKQGRSGVITIAAYPGISIRFLPKVVANFIKEYDGISVRILSHSSRLIRDMMPDREYDIGIVELPANNPAVCTEKYFFKCVCVLPAESKLTKKTHIQPEDLDGIPFVIPFKEHIIHHQIKNIFEQRNSRLNIIAEVRYFFSACEMISSGLGATIVDPVTASFFVQQGAVVRPFLPEVNYGIGITHSNFHQLSKPATNLRMLLNSELLEFIP